MANGGARERSQGAVGVCIPIGGTMILTDKYPQSFQLFNHQPKSTQGEESGWISMRGEALGPVMDHCPSVGDVVRVM